MEPTWQVIWQDAQGYDEGDLSDHRFEDLARREIARVCAQAPNRQYVLRKTGELRTEGNLTLPDWIVVEEDRCSE